MNDGLTLLRNVRGSCDCPCQDKAITKGIKQLESLLAENSVLRAHMRTCDMDAADIELGNLQHE